MLTRFGLPTIGARRPGRRRPHRADAPGQEGRRRPDVRPARPGGGPLERVDDPPAAAVERALAAVGVGPAPTNDRFGIVPTAFRRLTRPWRDRLRSRHVPRPCPASPGWPSRRTGPASSRRCRRWPPTAPSSSRRCGSSTPPVRRPPARLTRSAKGETGAAFLPDGSVVFTSARPDPDAKKGDDRDDRAALWLLPAGGGEARLLADPPAGVDGLAVARDSGAVVARRRRLPRHGHPRGGRRQAQGPQGRRRHGAAVRVVPIRFWDHYIGPRDRRLYRIPPPAADDGRAEPDLVLDGTGQHLTTRWASTSLPTAPTVLTGWHPRTGATDLATNLVAIDTATGERRTLAAGDVAYWRRPLLARRPLGGLRPRDPRRPRPRRPASRCGSSTSPPARAATSPPSSTSGPTARCGPPTPSPCTSSPTRTGGPPPSGSMSPRARSPASSAAGAFSDLCPSPDGATRLRPPQHRGVAPAGRGPRHHRYRPGTPADPHARVCPSTCPAGSRRSIATAADGTPVHSWLALPADASDADPAPLRRVDPRRAPRLVEQLALAVEPLAARRAGLRRAAARPGAVDRLRPGLRGAGPGPVGRRALHRSHGRHRRLRSS